MSSKQNKKSSEGRFLVVSRDTGRFEMRKPAQLRNSGKTVPPKIERQTELISHLYLQIRKSEAELKQECFWSFFWRSLPNCAQGITASQVDLSGV